MVSMRAFIVNSLPLRGALASLVVLAALMAGCSSWSTQVNAAEKPVQDRKPAPDFMLTDAKGASIKLPDYKGRVVLLNFWATWCGPCEIEIPWFVEFQNKYKDRGFAVLGVSMDEDGWRAVKPFLREQAVNYRVVLGDGPVARMYGGVESLPTTFLIDREGRIAAEHVGLAGKSTYEGQILRLLNSGKQADVPDAIPSVGADRLLPFFLQGPLLCDFIFRTKGRGSRARMTTHRILILGGG
jgi:cytochrome c biogenesis protein CcmG/thiol:disulfide interchange protein DsbE